jgi:hypothetical protein
MIVSNKNGTENRKENQVGTNQALGEARRIAAYVAKLPELVRPSRG